MRRQLTACCFAWLLWGCAKDEPPRPQAPQAAPAPAEPSDDERRPESKTAEEAPEAPRPGADLPKSSNGAAPTPQGGLKQEKAKREEPSFSDLASAEKAFKAADLELAQILGAGATALSDSDARCDRACQAFGSLERAADGICRLAGESDQRCSKARARVKEHSTRLRACDCK